MNFDAVTIERMVREVLNQVQAPAAATPPAAPAVSTGPLLKVPTATLASPAKLPVVIAERIVTADLIKERTTGGSRVVIGKQAILTPAAQDYLKYNKIAWERQDAPASGDSLTTARWKLLLSSVLEHVGRAAEAVCRQRSNVQQELTGDVNEAVNLTTGLISRAEVAGVMLVTALPEVAACYANRNSEIRATVMTDLATWSRVQPQLKPNVVCLNPSGRSFMELQNLIVKVVTSSPT